MMITKLESGKQILQTQTNHQNSLGKQASSNDAKILILTKLQQDNKSEN